jgi:hypothetical protein
VAYETRTYDNEHGDPVVVLVTTGTHDVSRLVQLFSGHLALCEQLGVAERILRQVKRHNGGRAALALLKAHGGADFTDEESPTTSAALGAWQLDTGVESGSGADRLFRALLPALGEMPYEITEEHADLELLADFTPFTVLTLGADVSEGDDAA